MHLCHIPQCPIQNRKVHISVLNGGLWDMDLVHSGICECGQLHQVWQVPEGHRHYMYTNRYLFRHCMLVILYMYMYICICLCMYRSIRMHPLKCILHEKCERSLFTASLLFPLYIELYRSLEKSLIINKNRRVINLIPTANSPIDSSNGMPTSYFSYIFMSASKPVLGCYVVCYHRDFVHLRWLKFHQKDFNNKKKIWCPVLWDMLKMAS